MRRIQLEHSQLAAIVADVPPQTLVPTRHAPVAPRLWAHFTKMKLSRSVVSMGMVGRIVAWAAMSTRQCPTSATTAPPVLFGAWLGLAGSRALTNYGFLNSLWPIVPTRIAGRLMSGIVVLLLEQCWQRVETLTPLGLRALGPLARRRAACARARPWTSSAPSLQRSHTRVWFRRPSRSAPTRVRLPSTAAAARRAASGLASPRRRTRRGAAGPGRRRCASR